MPGYHSDRPKIEVELLFRSQILASQTRLTGYFPFFPSELYAGKQKAQPL